MSERRKSDNAQQRGAFGEPWHTTNEETDACRIYDSAAVGHVQGHVCNFGAKSLDGSSEARDWANARRIVCVNACAGMTDPAAEIARLRHELSNAIDVSNAQRTALTDHDNAENYRVLHDEAQEEIESLRLQLYDANAHANDFKHDCEEYRAEIAKLRAEIELLKSYRKVEEEDRLAARHSLYQEIRDVLKSRGLHVSAFAKLADKEGQSNLIGDVARAIEKLKQDNEALKAHVREQGEKYTSAWADAEKLRAQVERMRGALEFYASPGAWCGRDFIVPGQVLPSEAENDRGKMARAALEGGE